MRNIVYNRKVIFIYFYVHWCFACVYVCVRVSEPLELELHTAVSCPVELNQDPLEEQPVFLTTEPSLQLLRARSCEHTEPWRPEDNIGSFGAAVRGGCEPPGVGSGKQTWIFHKATRWLCFIGITFSTRTATSSISSTPSQASQSLISTSATSSTTPCYVLCFNSSSCDSWAGPSLPFLLLFASRCHR